MVGASCRFVTPAGVIALSVQPGSADGSFSAEVPADGLRWQLETPVPCVAGTLVMM